MSKSANLSMHPRHLKISELSQYSNTSSATIRYYVREGILPEPIRTSMTMAYYDDVHVNALQTIIALKEKGLSLQSIKEIINKDFMDHSNQKTPMEAIYNSKRGEIVEAAVRLFRKKGYDSTSVDEIIKTAGVGKGTFYQYFKNKELLFFECTDSVFQDIGTEVSHIREEEDAIERLRKRAVYFGRHQQHLVDMLNIVRGGAIKENVVFKEKLDSVVNNLVTPIQKELDIAIAEKRIRLQDSSLLSFLLWGAAEYAVYYYRDHKIHIDEIMQKTWDIAFHGIYSADGLNELPKKPVASSIESVSKRRNSDGTEPMDSSLERKEKIVSAAVETFFQNGYSGATITDIANRTRISKEVFYIYFKNKDELFIECANRIFHDMYKHVWQSIKEEKDMFKRIWKRIHAFNDSYPQWALMMDLIRSLSVSENQVFRKKLYQLLRQMLDPVTREVEQLRKDGRFRKDLDSSVAGYVLMGMIEFGSFLIQNKMYSRQKVNEYLDQILKYGIMPSSDSMNAKTE